MRSIFIWICVLLATLALARPAHAADYPVAAVTMNSAGNGVSFLSWDTEGGDRARLNLLHEADGILVERKIGGTWSRDDVSIKSRLLGGGIDLVLRDSSPLDGNAANPAEYRVTFHFDPRMVAFTVLPTAIAPDGAMTFPSVASAPDFGQMYVTIEGGKGTSTLVGDREAHTLDWVLDLRQAAPSPVSVSGPSSQVMTVHFRPCQIPIPRGLTNAALWKSARRAWWNEFQVSSQWGDQSAFFGAPCGVLANNVVSDPVSGSLWLYADHALLVPAVAPGISALTPIRSSLDWWISKRMLPSGQCYSYWDYASMMDSNPSLLISAWDYAEGTGDRFWLRANIDKLEKLADYLASRDVDGDGIVESVQSGNAGTLHQPGRGDSIWDTINSGHKNSYINAQAYRAWLCLADLETKLGRNDKADHYRKLAARIRAAFAATFINPDTGLIAWWKSDDGELHDFSSPSMNSLPISYGLVSHTAGKRILVQIKAEMDNAGYFRYELGVPCTLKPVPRADYLQGLAGYGIPSVDDGSDTFGEYLNGGVTVTDTVFYLDAYYATGQPREADAILHAMLDREQTEIYPNGGAFQNGVLNDVGNGAEFFNWHGKPSGYEGYLSSSFSFLNAVLLREPQFRARLYRPMMNLAPVHAAT